MKGGVCDHGFLKQWLLVEDAIQIKDAVAESKSELYKKMQMEFIQDMLLRLLC